MTQPSAHRFSNRIGDAIRHGLPEIARRGLDMVLPPLCPACSAPVAGHGGVCAGCWSRLQWIERPYCDRLGLPFAYDLGPGAVSAAAIADPPPYGRARAAAIYDSVARDLVLSFKFHDRQEIAGLMGRWMVRAGQDILADADLLVPVPLHRRRLWWRRFNQSALLAEAIGHRTGVAHAPAALARIRPTRQQVGLTGRERDANMRGAFRVSAETRQTLHDRRVVLVDDVITSGATIAACTRALLRAKARQVDVLAFARVVPDRM